MSDATPGSGTGTGNATPKQDFVQMSALLTGFAADAIAPPLDPVNLAGTLFKAAQQGAGEAFDELLAQYAKLSGGKPVKDMTPAERRSIGEKLLGLDGGDPGSATAATARSVMRLWYLGYWYPIEDGGGESVVSDQAYIRGLAWKAMQSHAMGYSTLQYGYWAESPPPLTAFTGNPAPGSEAEGGGGRQGGQGTAASATGPAAEARPPSTLGQGKGGQSPAALPEGEAS